MSLGFKISLKELLESGILDVSFSFEEVAVLKRVEGSLQPTMRREKPGLSILEYEQITYNLKE